MEGAFGRGARKSLWQPEADGGGTLVDKFAHETGWAWSPERRQDGAGRIFGIVGGYVGNALPQAPCLDRADLEQLAAEPVGDGCLAQLSGTTRVLEPNWAELRDGERSHDQFPRSLVSGIMVGNVTRMPAHLRSHAGPGASEVLCGAPVASEFKV